jgi:hypothetical protein
MNEAKTVFEVKNEEGLMYLDQLELGLERIVKFSFGGIGELGLVREEEVDIEKACDKCFFKTRHKMCVLVPCSGEMSVTFRQVRLEKV